MYTLVPVELSILIYSLVIMNLNLSDFYLSWNHYSNEIYVNMMERILGEITSLIILIIKRDYYNEMMI